jgi:hypothetical protein
VLHTAVQIAQEATEHAEPAISPITLGVLSFGGLVALLVVTYAFRNVGSRH